jgi:HEAT repeat protein
LTSAKGAASVPVKVTYVLLEGAERERILNPPKVQPKAYTDAEMVGLLADLRGADDNKRWAAVDKLGKAKATTRREEVAKALDPLLLDKNNFRRTSCLTALAVWGTKDNVPSLLPILSEKDGWVRTAAVKALGEIGDERAAEPIAKLLTEWFGRAEASKALQKIGSKAEKFVVGHLEHADFAVRAEACRILAVIGTRQSKPPLDKASGDSNPLVAAEAKRAAKAAAARP